MPLHAIPFAVAVVGATRLTSGIDLSPSTIISGISGFFSGVVMTLIGDIIGPIANAISWAAAQLEPWVLALWNQLEVTIGEVPAVFDNVVDFIEGILAQAEDYADFLVNALTTRVAQLEADIGSIGAGLLAQVQSIVFDWIEGAINVGGFLWNWIDTEWVTPIYDYLAQVISGIEADILAGVQDALTALFTAGSWVYDIVSQWISDALSAALAGLGDIVDIVESALPFLQWVVGEGQRLWDFFTGDLPELAGEALINAALDALDRESDTAAAVLDRMFG